MDENLYPAYFEDVDYAVRVHLSGYRAVVLPKTPLMHGSLNGSMDYLSGVFDELYLHPTMTGAELAHRRQEHYLGVTYAHDYLERKWGAALGSFAKDGSYREPGRAALRGRPLLQCRSASSINGEGGCNPAFKTPFGRSGVGIDWWEMDWRAREEIWKSNP